MESLSGEKCNDNSFRHAETYTGSTSLLEVSKSLDGLTGRPLGETIKKGAETVVKEVRAAKAWLNDCLTVLLLGR